MRRSLRGPSLTIEADNVVRIRFLKVTTFVLAFVALFSAGCAALADGRHHREVLRCTRHASRSRTRLEDNDCVLTATPRGVDRFFEKRSRSSFEIAGAELRLEMSNALRTRTLRRRCNSSDADAVRAVVAAMARDIDEGTSGTRPTTRPRGAPFEAAPAPLGAEKGAGGSARAHVHVAPPRPTSRRRAFSPEAAWRGASALVVAVVVSDESGGEHVVHVFDDATRAAAALGAVERYLGASARDANAPVSLALRFDDSGVDEVLERGRKRAIQRRFNVGVLEALSKGKASMLGVRPEG